MSKQRKILIVIIIILWIQIFLILGIVKVSGESMNNTLEDSEKYYTKDIEATTINRFDILIINSASLNEKIVKRVVGLPGETINYSSGNLYVNQVLVNQDFDYIEDNDTFSITLGPDEYYVLGDNRANSVDSRRIGPIKYEEIESKLFKS